MARGNQTGIVSSFTSLSITFHDFLSFLKVLYIRGSKTYTLLHYLFVMLSLFSVTKQGDRGYRPSQWLIALVQISFSETILNRQQARTMWWRPSMNPRCVMCVVNYYEGSSSKVINARVSILPTEKYNLQKLKRVHVCYWLFLPI